MNLKHWTIILFSVLVLVGCETVPTEPTPKVDNVVKQHDQGGIK